MEAIAAQEGHPVVDKGAVIRAGQIPVGLLGVDAVDAGGSAVALGHGTGHQRGGNDPLAIIVHPQLLGAQIDLHIAATVGLGALGAVGRGPAAGLLLGDTFVDVIGQRRLVDLLAVEGDGVADGAAAGGDKAALVVASCILRCHLGCIALNGGLADADLQLIGDMDKASQGGGIDGHLAALAALGGVGIGQGNLQIGICLLQGSGHLLTGGGDLGSHLRGRHLGLRGGLQQSQGRTGGIGGGIRIDPGAVLTGLGLELLLGAVVGCRGIDGSRIQALREHALQQLPVVSKDGLRHLAAPAGKGSSQILRQRSLVQLQSDVRGRDRQLFAIDGQLQLIGCCGLVQGCSGILQAQRGQVHTADHGRISGRGRGGNGGGLRGGKCCGLGGGLRGGSARLGFLPAAGAQAQQQNQGRQQS